MFSFVTRQYSSRMHNACLETIRVSVATTSCHSWGYRHQMSLVGRVSPDVTSRVVGIPVVGGYPRRVGIPGEWVSPREGLGNTEGLPYLSHDACDILTPL